MGKYQSQTNTEYLRQFEKAPLMFAIKTDRILTCTRFTTLKRRTFCRATRVKGGTGGNLAWLHAGTRRSADLKSSRVSPVDPAAPPRPDKPGRT